MSTSSFDSVLPMPLAAASNSAARPAAGPHRLFGSICFGGVEPFRRPLERRREARYPYPYPIHLTPFAERAARRRSYARRDRQASVPHGIDFYCRQPLAERRVIASLDCGREGWIGLVVELEWCRFSRHGWYDNGGRFVAVVPTPLLGSGRSSASGLITPQALPDEAASAVAYFSSAVAPCRHACDRQQRPNCNT